MIEIQNVQKKYGNFEALKNVSFTVPKGEILGFLGPNGAGKTTMMRILTGFFTASSGTTRINGLNLEENPLEVQKVIGYLPENVPLYYEMSIRNYLIFVARIKGVAAKSTEQHIQEILEKCGLGEVARKQIRKLSRGYKQRVGLAQALVGNPSVLILDEPTSGLDPKQIIEIRSLIKKMAGEKTIILSTHILPEVSAVCDRVIIINEGTIVAEDTPQNLERKLQSGLDLLIQARGDASKISEHLKRYSGVLSVKHTLLAEGVGEWIVASDGKTDLRSEIAKDISKHFELLEMKTLRLSLEDIFVKLVTQESEASHA